MRCNKQTDYPLETLPQPVIYQSMTPQRFSTDVVPKFEPAVFKGFARDWDIVKAARQSAGDAAGYLQHRAAKIMHRMVIAPADIKGRIGYNQSLDGMNFQLQDIDLARGIEQMINGDSQAQEQRCFQSVPVTSGFPALLDEIPNPLVSDTAKPFVWVGNRLTVSPHFDEANNIAVVATGRRRFTFFPPEQLANLYIGPLNYTPAGQPVSLVDLHEPDLQRFPRYAEAYQHGLSVELEAGDAVYIPSPWWHHVQSLEPFNILINYWWSGSFVSSSMPFTFLLHGMQVTKNMTPAQRQAWKSILDYYLFEEGADPAAHIPEPARGVLGQLTPEMAAQLHQWLAQQIR
ncbi:cupin-like domain-containing protein [Lacimicrobium alkaliphilum]|uniref:Cupin n=1 Tax=Lacimicrobium alkaliphilum TaxID=1526571 RepID=A0ABQ1RQ20_9ALTE|nr:cupin-like domain-containing protein [Lacimicrobium alkaliphilum]GGD74477.1 cupin [Lacimicrobium alkaliphilum]